MVRNGRDGRDGKNGEPGPRGEIGHEGQRGEKGFDGAKGAKGEQGLPGDRGATGPQGDIGNSGRPGDPGIRGAPGEKGNAGATGASGKNGKTGSRGPTGPTGATGTIPDHKWDGTRLTFEKPNGYWGEAVDLVGPKGAPGGFGSFGGNDAGGTGGGATGATGPAGATGSAGATGATPRYRRDTFVASAGNNTFTRDQSVYADASSTLVITVGGTEIFDTIDFTTVGLVDTMNTPFAGGEIVSHSYWTVGSSPAATTLTSVGGGTYGFDPANTSTNITLSGTSNVTATRNAANGVGTARSLNSRSSGKLFFQVQLNSGNNTSPFTTLGVVDSTFSPAAGFVGADAHGWGIIQDGTKYTNNVATAYGSSFGDGNTIDVAIDFTGGAGAVKIWCSDTTGAWPGGGNPTTGANPMFSNLPATLWAAVTPYRASSPSSVVTLLSRAADLTRSPPSGYSSWD